MICVSIQKRSIEKCLEVIQDKELTELRLDLMCLSAKELQQLLSKSNTHIIATCRKCKITDNERIAILEAAIEFGASYVDIDINNSSEFINEIKDSCGKHSCKLILSYHNYDETPNIDFLRQIITDCKAKGADLVKIACMASSKHDTARILSLYEKNENLVAFCMGEIGKITRIASLFLGAPFSYASVSEKNKTAPGQFTYQEMKQIIATLQHD